MGKFIISKRANDQFQFNLKADNNQVILTSQGYATKHACETGIASVRENSADDENFERNKSSNGKHYFNLKAANSKIIGTSEMYETISNMEIGIASVKKNAHGAEILEE